MRPKHILKLDDHDEEQEMDFELEYLMSFSLRERFSLLEMKRKELRDLLNRHGHSQPAEIIKRS